MDVATESYINGKPRFLHAERSHSHVRLLSSKTWDGMEERKEQWKTLGTRRVVCIAPDRGFVSAGDPEAEISKMACLSTPVAVVSE